MREHADVAELTGLLMLPGWPQRMRVIVRREHPHPGAPLSLFEHHDGWRYQAFVTNTPVGQLALLEARHRAHARVEDRIRHAKDTGLGRLPSREYTINQAWLTCVTLAADLTAWLRLLALPEALKTCQPKALRYRLLHVPRPAHPRRAATTPPAPEDLAMGLRSLGNLQPSAGHPRPRLTPVTVPTTHQLRTSKTRTAAPRGAATRPQPPPPPSPAPAPDDNLIPGPVKDRG